MTNQITNSEQATDWRWQIVQAKDARFDGAFYTGVLSTKIYCKPSCPARRPKRENVTFFTNPEEAERAGLRACLRCRPKAVSEPNATVAMIARACEMIEKNSGDEISLELLAARLNVSVSHLQRTFKQLLGVSPKEFSDAQKFDKFKEQAKQTDVTTAMYESGFNSSRALYEKAIDNLGMTPATYTKGGKGMRINFAVTDCSLGKLLVAATDKGICAVNLGETERELAAKLKEEFPAAQIEANDVRLQKFVRAIVEHLDGERKTLELPLDLQATAFQLQVWSELRRIPRGETRSYKQVAEQIGNVKAVRAVARACAANPVALVTPCHRVIGTKGNLSGYRWGKERKKMLLEKEQTTEN